MIEWLLTATGLGIMSLSLLVILMLFAVAYVWGMRDCNHTWKTATGITLKERDNGEFRDELLELRGQIGRLRKEALPPERRSERD